MGRHPGTEHTAAAVVAVAALRNHRLVDRLLDRLSGLATRRLLQRGTIQLEHTQRRHHAACGPPTGARTDDGAAFFGVAATDRSDAGIARLRPRSRPACLRR